MVRIHSPIMALTTALLAHSSSYSAAAFVVPMTTATTMHRHFSSSGDDNFATADQVQELLKNERTVILDVRRADEIQASGYLKTASNAWVTIPCTPTDASLLQMTASNLLRDKSAPILVHCALGKRAEKAKQVLEEMGYENVVNAGGFSALEPFVEK